MTVMHCVVGYDPETEAEKFSLRIPPESFASVSPVVEFNKDDLEGMFSYELNYAQVRGYRWDGVSSAASAIRLSVLP